MQNICVHYEKDVNSYSECNFQLKDSIICFWDCHCQQSFVPKDEYDLQLMTQTIFSLTLSKYFLCLNLTNLNHTETEV